MHNITDVQIKDPIVLVFDTKDSFDIIFKLGHTFEVTVA